MIWPTFETKTYNTKMYNYFFQSTTTHKLFFAGQRKQYNATKPIEYWPIPIKLKKKFKKKNKKLSSTPHPQNTHPHAKKTLFAQKAKQYEPNKPV